MATLKHRINISLPDSLDAALLELARRDNMPQATKAAELLHLAVEIEEDQIWNALAKKRDTKQAKYIAHEKAWQ